MEMTLNQLKAMSIKELLEFAVHDMIVTPKMRVVYIKIGDIPDFEHQLFYTFEKTKKYFRYDKEKAILYVPHIDEREHELMQRVIFSKKKRPDRIPRKKFFNVLRVFALNELFGITTCSFDFLKIGRKDDPRFPDDKRTERTTEENMYYLYDEKTFQQVPPLDVVKEEEEENPFLKEFNRRNEMKEYVLLRLDPLNDDYLYAFDEIFFLENPMQDKKELLNFYGKWNHFLSEEIEQGMQLAFIFNHISPEEYNVFIEVIEHYQPIVRTKFELLKTVATNDKGEVSKEWYQRELEEITAFLLSLMKEREEKKDNYGFFPWERKVDGAIVNVINPTVAEVERRSYYMDVASKYDDEKRKNQAVVDYLSNIKEKKKLKAIEKPALLEKGDHQTILNIIKNNMERHSDTKKFLDYVSDKSKISLDDLRTYMDALVEERNRKEKE